MALETLKPTLYDNGEDRLSAAYLLLRDARSTPRDVEEAIETVVALSESEELGWVVGIPRLGAQEIVQERSEQLLRALINGGGRPSMRRRAQGELRRLVEGRTSLLADAENWSQMELPNEIARLVIGRQLANSQVRGL